MDTTERLAAVLLVVMLLLAGCGGTDDVAAGPTAPDTADTTDTADTADTASVLADATGDWVLTEGTIDGDAVADTEPRPTVTLDGTSIGGTDQCNTFSGELAVSGDGIRVDSLRQTERACTDHAYPGFAASLTEVNDLALDGDRLVLSGDGVELVLRPATAPQEDGR